MSYYWQGLLLGLAYVAPIGMQNLYVINTAASESKARAYLVALVTVAFDISLALACFWGAGWLLSRWPWLQTGFLLSGSLAVLWIGWSLLRSRPGQLLTPGDSHSLLRVVVACFSVTWLNPQAVIDGTLLFGGFRATLSPAAASGFIAGVASASCLWFTGLTTLVSQLRQRLQPGWLRVVNLLCGSLLIWFGLRLAWRLLQSVLP